LVSFDYLILFSFRVLFAFRGLVAGFSQQVSKICDFYLIFGTIMVSYPLVAVFIQ
jgi:hypothetical protein